MNITTLEYTDIEKIRKTFNLAFSDYEATIDMDILAFSAFLRNNSIALDLSSGLFDGQALVGFILVGSRGEKVYDGGTAIVKEYRGNGWAKKLLAFTIEKAKEKGAKSFELEVLKNNTRALKLYESFGFRKIEDYVCFNILQLSEENLSLKEVPIEELQELEESLIYKPSWQNQYASLSDKTTALLYINGESFIAIRKAGSVLSFSARNYENLKALIATTLKIYPKLRFVNQREDNPLVKQLLEENIAEVFAYQYRMVLNLL